MPPLPTSRAVSSRIIVQDWTIFNKAHNTFSYYLIFVFTRRATTGQSLQFPPRVFGVLHFRCGHIAAVLCAISIHTEKFKKSQSRSIYTLSSLIFVFTRRATITSASAHTFYSPSHCLKSSTELNSGSSSSSGL
jgi:hypothetical protein